MKSSFLRLSTAVSALALAASAGFAAPFTAGNVVLLQIGDGNAPLSTAATPVFLVEVNPTSGAIVQTIAVPSTASGANRALCVRGTSTSVGHLNLSVNGQYLTLAGVDAPAGTPNIQGTQSATNPRVVGRVDGQGVVDTTTGLTDAYNADDVRSAISTNGTDLWVTGTSSTASTAGVRYATFGSSTSVQLSSTPTNTRVVGIFNDQLYVSTMSGAFRGINAVGTGTPTTSGQTTTLLSGFDPATTAPESAYAFFFANSDTLYVADDRTLANGGGVQKWTFDSGTGVWTLAYTLNTGISTGCRGLTGKVSKAGTTLWTTTGEGTATPNTLVTVLDAGASSAFTLLTTSPTNTQYRGVAFAPASITPPPSCYANCDHSTTPPVLNVNDFICFQSAFAAGDSYANCDGSTTPPVLNVNDFICFQTAFAAGCTAP